MNAVSLGGPVGAMAPVESLQGIDPNQANRTDEAGVSFLKKLCSRLDKEEIGTDRMFWRKWFKVEKFYEGEHLGRFSEVTGQYRSYQPQQGDPYFVLNEIRYHMDAISSQWVQARFDIRVLPSNDQEETVYKARCAAKIVDHYEDIVLTEDFNQREGKLGQVTGNMYRYSFWDMSKGPKVMRQEFGMQEAQLAQGHQECMDCGSAAPAGQPDGLQSGCASCGSMNLMQVPGASAEMPSLKQGREMRAGDITTETVPAFQVKMDRSQADSSKAQWLRRKRILRPEFVQQVIDWWRPSPKSMGSQDQNIRAERMLQRSTGTSSQPAMMQGSDDMSGVVVSQWWLCPSMYAGRGPEPQEIKFANGSVIPAGSRMVDVFPTGLYLLVIDEKIVDVREEYLHDHWQHTPFILIPTRAEGDGVEDLLEPQRQLNDMNSLVYVDAKANAAPPTLVNTTMGIKTEHINGKPHWNVPIRVPTGESIDNAVRLVQGRSMPGHVFAYINALKGSMQILAKSFSSSTGAPDVADLGGVNTATGAQLMASNAVAQRGPELALRAAGNAVWAKQVLKLFQKNAIDQHYVPMQGRYGAIEGAYFKGSDVDADFIITVRKRSWMPRNEFERRQDLLGAMQAGLINPALPRSIRDAIAEHFNIDIDIISDSADLRIARMRLDKMKQAEQLLSMQPVPPEAAIQIILQAAPLEPLSDDMMVQREWYVDWLKRDEGLMASSMLRQAVTARLMEIDGAMAEEMARQQALQMVGMAPQMEMQMSMQDHQRSQQIEDEEAGHDRQMELADRKEKSKPKPKQKEK